MALVIPWDGRVGPGQEQLRRHHPGLPLRRDGPHRRLGTLFARLGVPVVTMLPVFEAEIDRYLPPRGGHLNPAAHRMVADAVAGELERSGLLR